MVRFQLVQSPREITLSSEWSNVDKFKSRGRIVNAEGRVYVIISKKEYIFDKWTVAHNIFFGALKAFSHFDILLRDSYAQELLFRRKITMHYAVEMQEPYPYSAEDLGIRELAGYVSLAFLEEDINFTLLMAAKVQSVFEALIKRDECVGVKYFPCRQSHRVFTLSSIPGLIFKMSVSVHDDSIKKRYRNMLIAQQIIQEGNLHHLMIPHAKVFYCTFYGENYDILVEQKLNVDTNPYVQQKLYLSRTKSLENAIRQLTQFICLTGYFDISYCNLPLLESSTIALLDLEDFGRVETGLFGSYFRRNCLMGIIAPSQAPILAEAATRYGVRATSYEEALERRVDEVFLARKLEIFHKNAQIVTGAEPISLEADVLYFYAVEKKEKLLVNLTMLIVEEINAQIMQRNEFAHPRERRNFCILMDKNSLLFSKASILYGKEGFIALQNQKLFRRMLNKLEDIGLLFSIQNYPGYGFHIQA